MLDQEWKLVNIHFIETGADNEFKPQFLLEGEELRDQGLVRKWIIPAVHPLQVFVVKDHCITED